MPKIAIPNPNPNPMDWTVFYIRDNKRKPLTVYCAPEWNHSWFKQRFGFESINVMIHTLKEVCERQSGRCAYRLVGDELYIYDNSSRFSQFHSPKENNVTFKVFEVLLNGA